MLVLSRKIGDAIVFPSLDITVTVSQVRGRCVNLAIEAPDAVRILRKELVPTLQEKCESKYGEHIPHDLRNCLNSAGLSLNVLLRQCETGNVPESTILQSALEHLHALDDLLSETQETTETVKQEEHSTQPLALLVEDNENESSLLAAFLKGHGFRVVHALDGMAAINFLNLSSVTPDIVLLDMNMPGMNGPATVKVIRERTDLNNLKLFAVSGLRPEDTKLELGDTGVDRWFQKPIQPDELVRQIFEDLSQSA